MKKFLFILFLSLYYNKLFSNQLEDIIGNLSLYTINENETFIAMSNAKVGKQYIGNFENGRVEEWLK